MALKSRLGPMKYAVVISVGCSALLVRAATSTAGPSANSGAANAIATVNGEPISQKEFAESLSRVQMGLDFAVYDMQIGVVQQLIDDVLMAQEARKRGKTLAEFRSEIENGISIEDSLVTIVYLENRSDFAGISESEARQHIRDRLRKDKARELYANMLKGLRSNASITISLKGRMSRFPTRGCEMLPALPTRPYY